MTIFEAVQPIFTFHGWTDAQISNWINAAWERKDENPDTQRLQGWIRAATEQIYDDHIMQIESDQYHREMMESMHA